MMGEMSVKANDEADRMKEEMSVMMIACCGSAG